VRHDLADERAILVLTLRPFTPRIAGVDRVDAPVALRRHRSTMEPKWDSNSSGVDFAVGVA